MLRLQNGKLPFGEVQRLFDEKIVEGREIDYKRTVGTNDDAVREYMEDIVSFANTDGGWLLIGISETNAENEKVGYPTKIVPHNLEFLRFKEQTVNRVRDNISPKLGDIEVFEVRSDKAASVIAVRIGSSRLKPHVVQIGKRITCAKRNSLGKQPMDAEELRQAILGSQSLPEMVERFVAEGVGSPPAKVATPAWIVHVIPESSMLSSRRADLSILQDSKLRLFTVEDEVVRRYPNHLGVIGIRPPAPKTTANKSYVQWFRNGCVESATGQYARETPQDMVESFRKVPQGSKLLLDGLMLAGSARFLLHATDVLSRLELGPPLFVTCSLRSCAGWGIYEGLAVDQYTQPTMLTCGQLRMQVLEVQQAPQSVQEAAIALRPIFDELANAAGLWRSDLYLDGGGFAERVRFNQW
ncbi:MAG: ATP-binding protein [Fimbriimonadaceae bacterium]|nr:ATP-binding protein [Fimbriimonadaceae bacterium]NUM39268.1 ATP-binding protein [Armatimonadota bacterium]